MGSTIDLTIDAGQALRMAFLMSHYRQRCEIGPAKVAEAHKVLRRFALACEPSFDLPPSEFIEMLANDLNTPGCISLMHQYRKNGQGRKLFAALRFMGFFGSTSLPDEIKTLPPDHIWASQVIGLDALGVS